MKNIKILAALLFAAAVTAGCDKEVAPVSGTEPENVYGDHTLPQGNHDYDGYIADFYEDYGTLLLYKYVDHDLYWNVTASLQRLPDTSTATPGQLLSGYMDEPADENYVDEQLELIRAKFFRWFSESFLKEMLPRKIFLTRTFRFVYWRDGAYTTNVPAHCYSGSDYLAFEWGGPEIAAMTAAEKNAFQATSCSEFLKRLYTNGKIEAAPLFFTVSPYTNLYPNATVRPTVGILPNCATPANQANDWNSYVQYIVQTPYATLTAPGGQLDPAVDVNGMIRRKYDIITAHFRDTYGIDLQAIGNDLEI